MKSNEQLIRLNSFKTQVHFALFQMPKWEATIRVKSVYISIQQTNIQSSSDFCYIFLFVCFPQVQSRCVHSGMLEWLCFCILHLIRHLEPLETISMKTAQKKNAGLQKVTMGPAVKNLFFFLFFPPVLETEQIVFGGFRLLRVSGTTLDLHQWAEIHGTN